MRDEKTTDTKSDARGDARENVGNTARGTDADPKGPEFNDKTRHRNDRPDEFDETLRNDR